MRAPERVPTWPTEGDNRRMHNGLVLTVEPFLSRGGTWAASGTHGDRILYSEPAAPVGAIRAYRRGDPLRRSHRHVPRLTRDRRVWALHADACAPLWRPLCGTFLSFRFHGGPRGPELHPVRNVPASIATDQACYDRSTRPSCANV